MTESDLDAMIAAVRKLASDYPDTIYERSGCRYTIGFAGNDNGCLLGQAAKACNLSLYKEMTDCDIYDENYKEGESGTGFSMLPSIRKLYNPCSSAQTKIGWLADVQLCQDKKRPWGTCVSMADLLPVRSIAFKRWLFTNNSCPDFGERYNYENFQSEYGISRTAFLHEYEDKAILDSEDYWASLDENSKKALVLSYSNYLTKSIDHFKSELEFVNNFMDWRFV